MKKLLIISPYFAPSNAADSHRIRMSLPYFTKYGWIPEIVAVHHKNYEAILDTILLESIPKDIKTHYVDALSSRWTRKIGLGSLALRSLWYYFKQVNQLLKAENYDLVYFSTTQFPVCILGAYWKKKFKVPYVIDMQDPWHSDYYQDKPKNERPPKYWFSYRLNKWLEPLAMKQCDGLISVSEQYISDLRERYSNLKNVPYEVITFGYSDIDYTIAKNLPTTETTTKKLKLAYIGVLGQMMKISLTAFFKAAQHIPDFNHHFKLIFKGTSYDNNSNEKKAVKIAEEIGNFDIEENPKRIGMMNVIAELQNTDGLIIFGTDDPSYTASKVYPYIQSQKPILAILHESSSAFKILREITSAVVIPLLASEEEIINKVGFFLQQVRNKNKLAIDMEKFVDFSADSLTKRQTELFEKTLRFGKTS